MPVINVHSAERKLSPYLKQSASPKGMTGSGKESALQQLLQLPNSVRSSSSGNPLGAKSPSSVSTKSDRFQGRRFSSGNETKDQTRKLEGKLPADDLASSPLLVRWLSDEAPSSSTSSDSGSLLSLPQLSDSSSTSLSSRASLSSSQTYGQKGSLEAATSSVIELGDVTGRAAGSAALSMRDKVAVLQKRNNLLERRLRALESGEEHPAAAEAVAAAAAEASAASSASAAALRRIEELEAQLKAAEQKAAAAAAEAETLRAAASAAASRLQPPTASTSAASAAISSAPSRAQAAPAKASVPTIWPDHAHSRPDAISTLSRSTSSSGITSAPVPSAPSTSSSGHADLEKALKRAHQELGQQKAVLEFVRSEYADLEALQKDTEAQRREFTSRYAFCVLDQDQDGYIRSEEVGLFDMFQPWAPATLAAAFAHWRHASAYKGFLTMEDFVRFVATADDRSQREHQAFWFRVLDADGDGYVSAEDAKGFYDAVDKKGAAFVVGFQDLWHQILDMVKPAQPHRGFSSFDLWKSKLGAGVTGLLLNHKNMLLQRTTQEWGRGEFPL